MVKTILAVVSLIAALALADAVIPTSQSLPTAVANNNDKTPQDMAASVVRLLLTVNKEVVAGGSGVVVSTGEASTGGCKVAILTARHVAADHASVTTMVFDRDLRLVPNNHLMLDGVAPSSIALHSKVDVALVVYLIPRPCSVLPYVAAEMSAAPLNTGDILVHIGYPHGQFMYGQGYFVATAVGPGREDFGWPNLGHMTSVAGPGSSGGAVFHNGKLVGILVGGELQQPYRNYFVHILYAFNLFP